MKLPLLKSRAFRFISTAALFLFYAGRSFGQIADASQLPAGESDRIDAYLEEYNAGVIVNKTVQDIQGETWSCVDIEHQPAFNNAKLAQRAAV